MGGRGASSGGRSGRAPRGYRTVGKAHGIPIIKSHSSKGKILPTKAKSNAKYLGKTQYGTVKQLRVYDKNGNVIPDAGFSSDKLKWKIIPPESIGEYMFYVILFRVPN